MLRMPIEDEDDDEPVTAVRRIPPDAHRAPERTARGVDASRAVQLAWALWRGDHIEAARDATMDAVSRWVSTPDGVDEEDLIALIEEVCGSEARAIRDTIRFAGALALFTSSR